MLPHGLQALGVQPEPIALVCCDDLETADLPLPGNYRGATANRGDRPCYHRGVFLSYSRMEILSWLAASYYLLSSSYAGRVDSRTWKADPAAKSNSLNMQIATADIWS